MSIFTELPVVYLVLKGWSNNSGGTRTKAKRYVCTSKISSPSIIISSLHLRIRDDPFAVTTSPALVSSHSPILRFTPLLCAHAVLRAPTARYTRIHSQICGYTVDRAHPPFIVTTITLCNALSTHVLAFARIKSRLEHLFNLRSIHMLASLAAHIVHPVEIFSSRTSFTW